MRKPRISKACDAKLAISHNFAIATYKQEAQHTEGHGKCYQRNFIWWTQQTVPCFLLPLASCANLVSPWCWHTSFWQTDYSIRNLFCGCILQKVGISTKKKLRIWWDTGNAIGANISWWKQDTVTEISTAKISRLLMKHTDVVLSLSTLWRADAVLPL